MSAWASGNIAAKLKARQAADKEPKPAPEAAPAAEAAPTPAPTAAPVEQKQKPATPAQKPATPAQKPATPAQKPATPAQKPAKTPTQGHRHTPEVSSSAAPAAEYVTLRHVSMPADLAALVSTQFTFVSQPAPPRTADRAVVSAKPVVAPTLVDPAPVHSSSAPTPYQMPRQQHHQQNHHPAPYRGNPSVNYFTPQPHQQPMYPTGGYINGYTGFGDIPRQYAMMQQMNSHYNAPSYYPRQGAYGGQYGGQYGAYNPYATGPYSMGPGRLQAQPAYYPPREEQNMNYQA